MTNQDAAFNLEQLRIDPKQIAKQPAKPAKPKKWRRYYVNVPWLWVERLQKAKRVGTYRLALVLVYEHWRTGARPIVLSNVFSNAECVPIRSKSRALAELESLGLIQVQRQKGRSPKVVLQHLGRNVSEATLAQVSEATLAQVID
jgi:hypothetical protein